jgi:hypothetical protein
MILAIDPGTTKSGWVLYDDGSVMECGVMENNELLDTIPSFAVGADVMAVEMIASYGMTVGRDTFETVLWIGRFVQRWADTTRNCIPGIRCMKVYRQDAKKCVCRTHKASDADIRSALIARLGDVGTKKAPGPLYGVKSHAWAALAVAVTAEDMIKNPDVWSVEDVA